jgi:hypothetical protein
MLILSYAKRLINYLYINGYKNNVYRFSKTFHDFLLL